MINPIQIEFFLKNRYMKYINAGIPLAHQNYVKEREDLYTKKDSPYKKKYAQKKTK